VSRAGIVLLFLLGPGAAGAAQREVEFWTIGGSLSQSFTDNIFLLGLDGPGEAITNASLRLSYARRDGSSSVNVSGWLGARRFNRFSFYGGPQFGLSASSRFGFGPRARLRVGGHLADGLNFGALGSGQIALPQIQVQSGSASAGFTYRLAPDTSADASLDATGIRYRADVLFDTSRLLGDTFVPAEQVAATPSSGTDEPPAPDDGLLALSLLASEGLETLRLDFGSWRAGAGISHDFSPRTRLTFGGGYRQTYQNPHTFSQGDQFEGQIALREVIGSTANLSLSYAFQENRFGVHVATHSLTAQADKELGKKIRLDASVGASRLDGPDNASSTWTLIGGAGFSARLKRSMFSARYTRSRYQGLIVGRSEVTDVAYASLGHTIGRRVSVSGFGYYRDARDELQRRYSYDTTMLGSSLSVRIKRRTSAGVSYNFLRFHTQNAPAAHRSTVTLHVSYSHLLK
jgi:hypothetical protein